MKFNNHYGINTKTGAEFEHEMNLCKLFVDYGFRYKKMHNKIGFGLFSHENLVARHVCKNNFYKYLDEENVNWKNIISKKILSDDMFLIVATNTLYIFEIKYQQVAGSVDEKIQTCDFKRKQYVRLVSSLGLEVKYIYILSDWFKRKEYIDSLKYIRDVGCNYFFKDELSLNIFGISDNGLGKDKISMEGKFLEEQNK